MSVVPRFSLRATCSPACSRLCAYSSPRISSSVKFFEPTLTASPPSDTRKRNSQSEKTRPMQLTRARALSLIAAAPLVVSCRRGDAVKVGSKNFTEELILGALYAQSLEHAGLHVARKLNLGTTDIAMAALKRGEIDLYPEYTGTALLTVLHLPPVSDPKRSYQTVKSAYAKQYDLVWLDPAPMNDTQALATTQAVAG